MSEVTYPSHESARSAVPTLQLAASLALVTLLPVAAHQLGKLPHLPDPPYRLFASDRITSSSTAHPFGVPDSLLGLASYSITLALALTAGRHGRARKLLALKLLADGTMAGINMVRQIVTFRRLCSWCTGTVLCTAAMLTAGRGLIGAEMSNMSGRKSGRKIVNLTMR